jgi:hypothetical protein
MIEMFVGKIPGLPRSLGTRGICAVLDERLVVVLDLPRPTPTERRAVEGALKLRARAVRLLPPRRSPRLRTRMRRRTYPEGYASRSWAAGTRRRLTGYAAETGRLAQLGERLPYKQEVGGSIPSPPIGRKPFRYAASTDSTSEEGSGARAVVWALVPIEAHARASSNAVRSA